MRMKKNLIKLLILINLIVILQISLFFNFNSYKNGLPFKDNPYINTNDSYTTYGDAIQLEWRAVWGGPEDEWGRDIAQDNEGFLYICGDTASYGSGVRDGYLLKYNKSGAIQWEQIWGGSGVDFFKAITIINNSIYIAAIRSSSIHLLAYNTSGDLLWGNSAGSGSVNCITHDLDGNIYLGGSTGGQFYLIKFNSIGTLIWTKTWGTSGPTETINDITLDSDGNFYLTGISGSHPDTYAYTAKIDKTGALKWENFWGSGTDFDQAFGIGIDSFNNTYVTGYNNRYEGMDILLIKYNQTGDEQWFKLYDFVAMDGFGSDIVIENTGRMYILGSKRYLIVNNTGGGIYTIAL